MPEQRQNQDDEDAGPPPRKRVAVDGSSEITQGAQRLALEMNEVLKTSFAVDDAANIPELQLATCRKLREVSSL